MLVCLLVRVCETHGELNTKISSWYLLKQITVEHKCHSCSSHRANPPFPICFIVFCIIVVYASMSQRCECIQTGECCCRQTLCFPFPSFFSIILPPVPFCLIYNGEREAGDKRGKYWETEWAVTLCDAICYPQRIASGLLTYSITLSTLVLINQMPVDV